MIQHEITICKFKADCHTLNTLNRDLELHREGDLPAYRFWFMEGSLFGEMYYLKGKKHREGDLPSRREWDIDGTPWREYHYLKGVVYDPT
jgi:hypothetical protein